MFISVAHDAKHGTEPISSLEAVPSEEKGRAAGHKH